MKFQSGFRGSQQSVVDLFVTTFSASEGAQEGAILGQVVKIMMTRVQPVDLYSHFAYDGDQVVGGVFLSRMRYPDDKRQVFILSPVAVATQYQGKGIGQALINHGLDQLRQDGVDVVLTYGDPNYYSRVGFLVVSTDAVSAPYPLSFPHGWQAQKLQNTALTLSGAPECVVALQDQNLW